MLATLLAALLAAPPAVVTARGAHVDVHAQAVPLDDVLEEIAARTGMELDWPEPRPRPLVTVTLADLPVAEAIPRLMQGLRFNYAMRLTPEGRVALLVVLDAAEAPEDPQPELPAGKRGRTAPKASSAP